MTFDPTLPIKEVKPSQYKHFCCGETQLDEYLTRFAKTNEKRGIGRNFLLVGDNDHVVGYYTLSMAQIDYQDIPETHQHGIPRYPIPAARLCRLAVDLAAQGQGIGEHLLMDAISRVLTADQVVAAHAMVVDAKNQKAKRFYQKHDFISLKDYDLKLFLPLATLRDL